MFKYPLSLFLFLAVAACSTPQKIVDTVKPSDSPKPPTFRVAYGSCNDQDDPQSHWGIVLSKVPQVWIWLGDNIYADTRVPRVMEAKYKKQFKHPEYQSLVRQVRVIGTWDDHDFGENDIGGNFPMKRKSKELFWDFMQEPKGSVLRAQSGVYRSELWNVGSRKVKLIILDTRYNRDMLKQNDFHEYIPSEGDILGAEQWLWLEKEMAASKDVDAIVVANGTQVLGEEHRFEKWANFPKSKDRLLKLLDESPSKIKILLSGDRHFGEISQLKLPSGSMLTEVVSSGLTHSYENADEPNPLRVGNLWPKTHFGLMDFYDDADALRVRLSIEDLKTQKSVNSIELK